jgi:hypothetical protein
MVCGKRRDKLVLQLQSQIREKQSENMTKLKIAIIAGVAALLVEGFSVLCFMGVGVVGSFLSWVGIILTFPAFLVSRLFQEESFNVFLIVGYLQFFLIFWFIVKRYGQRMAARITINRPSLWFRICGIILLLAIGGLCFSAKLRDYAEFSGELFTYSFCILMVGILGMIATLVLRFLSEKQKTEDVASQTLTSTKQKYHTLLTIACLAHAALVTAAVFHSLKNGAASSFNSNFFVYLWWTLLAAWPFWIFVFWKFSWQTNRIMITMIIGLLILSPIFFLFLIGWALSHGGSLG